MYSMPNFAPTGVKSSTSSDENSNFEEIPIFARNSLCVDIIEFFQSDLHVQKFSENEANMLEMIVDCITKIFDIPIENKCTIKLLDICSYYVGKCKGVPDDQICDADTCKDKGNCFMMQGHFAEAADFYSQAIALFPWSSSYFCNRALAYLLLKKYEKAIADTERALKLNPTCSRAYDINATAHASLGYWPQACAAFNKTRLYDPDNVLYEEKSKDFLSQFHNHSTSMLFGPCEGQSAETADSANVGERRSTDVLAEKELPLFSSPNYSYHNKNLTERDITLGNFYIEKALDQIKINRNEEAILSCKEALMWNPHCIPAYYIQGFGYLNLNNDEDSFAAFAQAKVLETQNNLHEADINMQEKIEQFIGFCVDLAELTRNHVIFPVKFFSNDPNNPEQSFTFLPFSSLYGMEFLTFFENNPEVRNVTMRARRLLVIDILKYFKNEWHMRQLSELKKNHLSMVVTLIESLYGIQEEEYYNTPQLIDLFLFYMDRSREFRALSDAQIYEAEIYRSMARSSMLQGFHNLAIFYFSKAIAINAWNADYYGSRAYAYLQTNRLQMAIEDCDAALRLDPYYLQVNEISWWAQARLAVCIVQPCMAYENFKAVSPYRPRPMQPSWIFVPYGQASAFADFASSFPLNPEHQYIQNLNLTETACEELKFPPEQMELTSQHIAVSDYHINHAVSALKANKNFVAIFHCEEAIIWNPFHTAAFYIIGLCYVNLHRYEEAARAFYKVEVLEFRRCPTEPVNIRAKTLAFIEMAGLTNYRILNILSFFSCSDIEFELQNTLLTKTFNEYIVLGHKDMECGDFYGAILSYTKAIKANKFIPELRTFRARAYTMVYKYRAAAKDCVIALKYNYKCAEAYDVMGLISMCRSEWMQACRCFTLAKRCNIYNKVYDDNFQEAVKQLRIFFRNLDEEIEMGLGEEPTQQEEIPEAEVEIPEAEVEIPEAGEVKQEAEATNQEPRSSFKTPRDRDADAWIYAMAEYARPEPESGKQAAVLCSDPCKSGSCHMFY